MRITVVTVCFNAAATIADTLDSVARQAHPEVEHLVIDGASRDATLEVVRAHGQRVARLVSEPDRGIYDAMNKGIQLAQGEVIGFLNADDVYADSGVLSRVAAAFEDPAVDACYADLEYVDPARGGKVVRRWKSSPFAPGAFAKGWCPPHPTFFVRRDVYRRLGGFDLSRPIGTDVVLMLSFLEVHRIRARYVPGVWVKMRVGGESNASVRNVVRQNLVILDAARDLGVPINPLRFLVHKLADRFGQIVAAGRGA